MTSPSASARTASAAFLAALSSCRRRLWLASATRQAVYMGALALLFSSGVVTLLRGDAAKLESSLLAGALVSWVAAWLVSSWWTRPSLTTTARWIDATQSGLDRAATSLERSSLTRPNDWETLQLTRAVAWLSGVDDKRVSEGFATTTWAPVWLACACLVMSLWMPLHWLSPTPMRDEATLVRTKPWPVTVEIRAAARAISDDDLDLLEADRAALRELRDQVQDRETRAYLTDVERLFKQVNQRSIDREQAFRRLQQLTRRGTSRSKSAPAKPSSDERASKANSDAGDARTDKALTEAVSRSLERALRSAPQGALRDSLRAAAKKKDLSAMSEALQKLARRAGESMDDKELKKWIEVAQKYAGGLKDDKLDQRFDRLRKRVRRLQQQQRNQGGLRPSERRRLRSARRELERLTREHGDVPAAKYALQRLQRRAQKAADELRRARSQRDRLSQRQKNRGSRNRGQQMSKSERRELQRQFQRAAREMRRQSQEQRARQARREARRRLEQMRRTLRRASSQRSDRAAFERRARQGRRLARNNQGHGEPDTRRGQRRQTGQGSPSGASGLKMGSEGSTSRMAQLRRMAKGNGGAKGSGQGDGAGAGDRERSQDRRPGAARTEAVAGVHGKGPTIKRVFLDAAQRGFAKRGWRTVYADYSEVAEEMLDAEYIPAGRKSIIRRYFELIRPR